MEQFINYINSELPDRKGDNLLYKFKKKTLDEMNTRANEVAARGIHDSKVIYDLIISEHTDLKKEYNEYYAKETASLRTKRRVVQNIIGSAIYLIAVVTVFLAVSFITHAWDITWAIVVDGVLLWVAYLLFLGVKKFTSMKRIFHIFARIFLAGMVVIVMVALFLLVVAVTDLPKSWLIIILGLIMCFICDGTYATLAKHRLAILSWLLYIPVIATFLFIIIGALALLPWSVAWIIIPLSLVIDLIIILLAIGKNRMHALEVEDIWKEN